MHITDDLSDGYLGSGKLLYRSIKKYGRKNFVREILEFYSTQELLAEAEKITVNKDLILNPLCMNIMTGGFGGFISVEQQRHRASCAGKAFAERLKNDAEFREKHAKLVGENMKKVHEKGTFKYDTFTGKTHTEETKQKMSVAKQGKCDGNKNSQFGTCWITKEGINKKIKLSELESFLNSGWVKGRK
jgi:hypothetical protein